MLSGERELSPFPGKRSRGGVRLDQLGRYWSLTVMPVSSPGFFSSRRVWRGSSLTPETGDRPREVPSTQTIAQGELLTFTFRALPDRTYSSCTLYGVLESPTSTVPLSPVTGRL